MTLKICIILCASLMIGACSGSHQSSSADSASAGGNVATGNSGNENADVMVRGTIESRSGDNLTVQTDSGMVNVKLTDPVQVYARQPGSLAHVTPNAFIGVTTVKQPDGSDRATEIHVFPEALRGLGEGSRPMGRTGGSNSTMTNGAMTNGAAGGGTSSSTMSNGSVQSAAGSTILVRYAGGSKTVTVPANTPVTEIVASPTPVQTGDRVVVIAKRNAGVLTSNRVLRAQ